MIIFVTRAISAADAATVDASLLPTPLNLRKPTRNQADPQVPGYNRYPHARCYPPGRCLSPCPPVICRMPVLGSLAQPRRHRSCSVRAGIEAGPWLWQPSTGVRDLGFVG